MSLPDKTTTIEAAVARIRRLAHVTPSSRLAADAKQ